MGRVVATLLVGLVLGGLGGLVTWGSLSADVETTKKVAEAAKLASEENAQAIAGLTAEIGAAARNAEKAANKADGAQEQAAQANAKLDVILERMRAQR